LKNDIKNNLKELSCVDFENAKNKAAEMLGQYFSNVNNHNGNIIGGNGPLLLDAHIDQVGFMVTHITDEGYLKIGAVGGIDAKILPGQTLCIYGTPTGELFTLTSICSRIGVVISTPPHLMEDDEKDKVSKISDLLVDCGFKDKDEAEKCVSKGDYAAWNSSFYELTNDIVCGKSFDDRAGMAAILHALSLLSEKEREKLTVVFSTDEEINGRGAKTAAFGGDYKAALAVDVSFAYTEGLDKAKCGIMGKGPMVGISPSLSKSILTDISNVLRTNKMPFQTEVMPNLTSTNADKYTVSRNGIDTALLSIPIKNMHSPTEIVSISDIELTGELLAKYVKSRSI
jgi:endoglucanase